MPTVGGIRYEWSDIAYDELREKAATAAESAYEEYYNLPPSVRVNTAPPSPFFDENFTREQFAELAGVDQNSEHFDRAYSVFVLAWYEKVGRMFGPQLGGGRS